MNAQRGDDGGTGDAAPTARRGRRPGGPDTRAAVLDAARKEFAALGYEKASIRGIARSAGVDSALVHHYFGTKQQLFIAALDFPIDPELVAQLLLTGERETAGDRIVRFALSLWEEPEVRERLMALLRTVAANDQVGELFRDFVERELVARVSTAWGEVGAAVRVELVMSQIVGLAMARYVIGVEPLASAGIDQVAALVGPVLQHYLDADIRTVTRGTD
ncbi:MAG TPA: TetR family transcriptional regulator [Actinospica sp.]|nr:TetR family transcriptional regulator [Actinospica sp.]